jgi:hypothetical protein
MLLDVLTSCESSLQECSKTKLARARLAREQHFKPILTGWSPMASAIFGLWRPSESALSHEWKFVPSAVRFIPIPAQFASNGPEKKFQKKF